MVIGVIVMWAMLAALMVCAALWPLARRADRRGKPGLLHGAAQRLRQLTLSALVALSAIFTVSVAHSGKMRSPAMGGTPVAPVSVTAEDISNGWRVVAETAGESFAQPSANVITNERWRLRGAHDDAFRIPADGWSYPYATGITVLSRGELHTTIHAHDFPRAFGQDMSLLPLVNWPMLPEGRRESLFWYAATPSNTLLATWCNAALGRDATNPVSFQAELFPDGGFAYRYEGHTLRHERVWSFDWDDDGLENSVDPDPLTPCPDAHGTNAEWYNTVCSNVFEASGPPGIALSPRTPDVNINAYYFVDVVAARGPAPIYFTGDRASRLGNPVVVARAGETNRVPLLIGVNYAVTSTVPFAVSVPANAAPSGAGACYAAVTTNGVSNCAVQWPLNFAFTESIGDSCRIYTANVEPYDPGGTFTSEPPLRGAPCGCASFNGNAVVFGCSPTCDCGGICKKGILYYLLGGATFAATGGVCRCGFEDPVPPAPVSYDPTSAPALSIMFSKPAVIFEEAYLDSEYGERPKRSTRVQLTVSAYGGAHGGSLAFSSQNLDKLSAVAGGMIDLPAITNIVPYESFFSTCVYEAADVSGSTNDVKVSGTFTESETGAASYSEGSLTAVKLEFTPNYPIDNYPHRHRVGVRESSKCTWLPTAATVICEAGAGGQANLVNGKWNYTAPLTAGSSPYLTAVCQRVRYPFALDIVEPQAIIVKSTNAFDYGVPPNVAGGAGMELELVVFPTNVSFRGIAVQEVPTDYKDPQGYFANSYFDVVWSHTTNRGAGAWHRIQAGNLFMYDNAEMGDQLPRMTPEGEITDSLSDGWIAGFMNWRIPVGWNETSASEEDVPVKQFVVYWQRFRMESDGTLEVEKLGNVVQRNTNSVVRLNGEIVPLRPR